MNDNKSLYFIRILAEAFDSPNQVESMHKAINEIMTLGEQEEYTEGYKYFNEFVKDGMTSSLRDEENHDMLIDKIISMLLSDDVRLSEEKKIEILDKIKNNPKLFKRYVEIYEEYFKQIPLEIEIYKDGNKISSQSIEKDSKEIVFKNIYPGDYIIGLSNGRLLWEGEILKKDVIWEEAFPEEQYPMAADTGDKKTEATRTEKIKTGEITLALYAGLESGKLLVSVN